MYYLFIRSFPDTYWSFRHALLFEGKRLRFPTADGLPNHFRDAAASMEQALSEI